MMQRQFNQVQDHNSINEATMHKATFKQVPSETATVGPPRGMTADSRPDSQAAQKEDLGRAGRILKNDEIREICEVNGLERLQVYKLRSEFAAMVQMSKEDEKNDKHAKTKGDKEGEEDRL